LQNPRHPAIFLTERSVVTVSMEGARRVFKKYAGLPEDRPFRGGPEACRSKGSPRFGVDISVKLPPLDRTAQPVLCRAFLNIGVSWSTDASFIVSDLSGRNVEAKGIPRSRLISSLNWGDHRPQDLTKLFEDRGVRWDGPIRSNTAEIRLLNVTKPLERSDSRQKPSSSARGSLDLKHQLASDYVPWQNDNKVCFLRWGKAWGGSLNLN